MGHFVKMQIFYIYVYLVLFVFWWFGLGHKTFQFKGKVSYQTLSLFSLFIPSMFLGDKTLNWTNVHKYLGVFLTNDMSDELDIKKTS